MQERNEHFKSNLVPLDLLLTDDLKLLCEWLCRFCAENRKKVGSPFPPRSIHHYLMGIQKYIRTEKKNNLNIINDSTFLPLKNLLDSLYRRLHSEGVGCSVKKTEALTDNDEDSLWTAGILDPHTAEGLLNCVFFLNGKNFCLRGGLEHWNLSPTQLQLA